MEKLINHPLNVYFQGDEDENSVYSGIINFDAILEKIEQNQYKTIDQWKNEMDKMWTKALSTYVKGSQIYAAAGDLKKLYMDNVAELKYSESEAWAIRIRTQVRKLNEYLTKLGV